MVLVKQLPVLHFLRQLRTVRSPQESSASGTADGKKFTLFRFARGCAYFYIVFHTVGNHIGELVICKGPSMQPTIQDGDCVLAERLSVRMGNLHHGDLIGCISPLNRDQMLCKRVVAFERDIVSGVPNTHRVPRGHCVILGDNSSVSTDSRQFGAVPLGLVQLRLALRVWPPSRVGFVSTHWFWEPEDDTLATST